MRSYSEEGIVLTRKNYGEADRILSLYSKGHGRISAIAKGVRRLASRKRGHIEVFSHIRFQAVNTKGLDLITEVETIENFSEIRKNLSKSSLAYYFMEVIGRTTHEGEAHPELFYLLTRYLNDLKIENKLRSLKNNFVTESLEVLGFWPTGKTLVAPEIALEEVIERNLATVRVGKRILE